MAWQPQQPNQQQQQQQQHYTAMQVPQMPVASMAAAHRIQSQQQSRNLYHPKLPPHATLNLIPRAHDPRANQWAQLQQQQQQHSSQLHHNYVSVHQPTPQHHYADAGPFAQAAHESRGRAIPGAHVPPQEKFNPGPQVVSLSRTGQSARHDAFFSPQTLRERFAQRRAAALDEGDPADPRLSEVAGVTVRQYHSLVPLDAQGGGTHSVIRSTLFKATSSTDGEAYALRRIDGPPLSSDAVGLANSWCALRHPSVVQLVDAFTDEAPASEGGWAQRRTYFVHKFHPGAQSLEWLYLVSGTMQPTEENMWSVALSLIGAIHAIHTAGAAVRSLDAAHVLLTDVHTVRISSIGVLDAVRPETQKSLPQLQLDDLQALGRLLVSLACQNPGAIAHNALGHSLAYISASFSAELNNLLMLLLVGGGKGEPAPTIHSVVSLVAGRMMTRMSQMHAYSDALSDELSKESENGRLLRLLAKLGVVCGRDALPDAPDWGGHADRYLLRLFLDSLYQGVDDEGRPVIEFARIVDSLNRLDVGHDSRVLLTGRDDGSLVVVSYADLRGVLERSFDEVTTAAEAQTEPPHASVPHPPQ